MAMSVDARADPVVFQSTPEDGLHEVVLGAAQAVMGQDLDSPGLLWIEPEGQSRRSSWWLGLEVTFAEAAATRTIAQLDVRVRKAVDELPADLVSEALAAFGGVAFTNLCVGPRPQSAGPGSGDVLDVTVSFPSPFPFYASNTSLLASPLSGEDRATCRGVLRALGVAFTESSRGLAIRRWQLRGRMELALQLQAFQAAMRDRRRACIYAAVLPPCRSVRIEYGLQRVDQEERVQVDLCLSQGLTSTLPATFADTSAMQELLERHLGMSLGGRTYRVNSRRWSLTGEREPADSAAVPSPVGAGGASPSGTGGRIQS
ncbi:hypothetical protein ACFL5O_00230 [Myxococcota bacterium]